MGAVGEFFGGILAITLVAFSGFLLGVLFMPTPETPKFTEFVSGGPSWVRHIQMQSKEEFLLFRYDNKDYKVKIK